MDTFKEGLENVLPAVTEQVYLFHFLLRESGIRTIIENSTNATQLVLRGCKIGDLRQGFKLDPSREYSLESLDLYWTCRKQGSEYLTLDKLKVLAEAMSKTKIRLTLTSIHLCKGKVDENDVKSIFNTLGFKVDVQATYDSPGDS